jgi:hypothetical protein
MVFGVVCTVFFALIAVHQTMAARKHQKANRENTAILAEVIQRFDETNKVLEMKRIARDDALNVIHKMLIFILTPYEGDDQRLKALDDIMIAASAMMMKGPECKP